MASSFLQPEPPAPSSGNEERFRHLVEAAPGFTWAANAAGEVTYANRRVYEYTGFDPELGVANWARECLHPDDLPRRQQAWAKAIAEGRGFELEARIRGHDGGYRWFLIRVTPVCDPSGCVVEWYGSGTDIDQRKRAEEELRAVAIENAKLAGALQEADRRKDEFLAMLAHELRNPARPDPQRGRDPATRSRRRPARLQWTRDVIERQVRQLVAPGRRPARRLAHHPRQDRAAPRARRAAPTSCARAWRPAGRSSSAAGHELTVALPAEPVCCSTPTVARSPRCSPTCSTTPPSTPSRAATSG